MVWGDNIVNSRIGELFGPFFVSGTDGARNLVFVQDTSFDTSRPFNATQVKLYHEPEAIAHEMVHESVSDISEPTNV